MTLTDKALPYYIWFTQGFAVGSIFIGIVNVGMLFVTLMTVKGIYLPSWIIPIAVIVLVICFISIGWFFEKYDIWTRINSHYNTRQNQQIKDILTSLEKIEEKLDTRHQ